MKDKIYHAISLLTLTHNDTVKETDNSVYMSNFYPSKDWMFDLLKWWRDFECSNKSKYIISSVEVVYLYEKTYRIILR